MNISWYPGHMHKASKEMTRLMGRIDMMIEVLDARMPMASSNPVLRRLRGDRPCLHILNKADLADPVLTGQWLAWFNRQRASANLPAAGRSGAPRVPVARSPGQA